MITDFHILPYVKDSISYIYIEHAVIVQRDSSIVAVKSSGVIPVPIASLICLLLGPGVSITHAAIKAIADCGCMVVWCGMSGTRFYAAGQAETRNARNLLRQAKFCMDEKLHMLVVRRMYEIRFPDINCSGFTLQQIRGMEGIRVRKSYQMASKLWGIKWNSRSYKKDGWDESDPVNRALSAGNFMLYNVCHAAIFSLGYSPALGFVHVGKMRSFVYDIADLYKANTTIPAAFEAVQKNSSSPEVEVRRLLRGYFQRIELLKRISKDIGMLFEFDTEEHEDALLTGNLWDVGGVELDGGRNYSGEEVIFGGSNSN